MTTPAIFKLDSDTLLSIFDIITLQIPDKVTPRPLTIIKAASQVCQDWRGLLLASPWIWGRLVDLNISANLRNVQLVEEVIRRTGGTSPLWIYGDVKKSSSDVFDPSVGFDVHDVESCFIRLLDSWERIERLLVHIDLDDKKTLNWIQNRFSCRAPSLKYFDVRLDRPLVANTLPLGAKSSQCLFSDDAPLLRTIKAAHVAYKPDSPWLSHIREIDRLPETITLQDLFILLQHTPMLETIGIYSNNLSMPEQALPSVTNTEKIFLQNLSSMRLWANLPVFAAFLAQVCPGNLSALVLKISDFQTENLDNPLILPSIKANLPSYIANYFTWNSFSKCVELSMLGSRFVLCNVTDGDWRVQNFEVALDSLLSGDDWNNISASVLDAFIEALSGNSSAFRPVTELEVPHLAHFQPTLYPKLHSVLSLFTHVQQIQTNGHTLGILHDLDQLSGPQHVLFPELHTLRLTALASGSANSADILQFLMERMNAGFPIASLDLTRCSTVLWYTSGSGLGNLEVVHGMEVVWRDNRESSKRDQQDEDKICSYICGTGDPDQLKNLKLV